MSGPFLGTLPGWPCTPEVMGGSAVVESPRNAHLETLPSSSLCPPGVGSRGRALAAAPRRPGRRARPVPGPQGSPAEVGDATVRAGPGPHRRQGRACCGPGTLKLGRSRDRVRGGRGRGESGAATLEVAWAVSWEVKRADPTGSQVKNSLGALARRGPRPDLQAAVAKWTVQLAACPCAEPLPGGGGREGGGCSPRTTLETVCGAGAGRVDGAVGHTELGGRTERGGGHSEPGSPERGSVSPCGWSPRAAPGGQAGPAEVEGRRGCGARAWLPSGPWARVQGPVTPQPARCLEARGVGAGASVQQQTV